MAKEAGEVVSREEGEAIYRATLESLLASTGWTPRAAEEMAREEDLFKRVVQQPARSGNHS